MIIDLENKDSSEILTNSQIQLSRLAFAKHFSIAGMGYAPKLEKINRVLGLFFLFRNYLRRNEFYNYNKFSTPPKRFSDPTEKSQFSNLAGKAIADYLSKQLDESLFTVNYEAAMKLRNLPIIGSRPDLIAFNSSKMFAIECKGYSKSSSGNMKTHKNQSQAGPIPVNFSIASISYNLYDKVKCKYYDPINSNVEYDEQLLKNLSQHYYSGINEFFNEKYFKRREIQVNEEQFFEIEIFTTSFLRTQIKERFPYPITELEHIFFDELDLKLIVPTNIDKLAENGINRAIEPFEIGESQSNYLYIDKDRIGLKIRN
ncbi:hypothetical protein [Marinigracilibium pacificum]|uniref:Uncharacterized protein n=1 Tax=Marinigracilibium pacificum TaxID=2729599 RepID=A0A848J9V3_9BACT|nr:hypothetical protein [Marinigracilibium pacificum]NMM49822.1 hypothetical protein [Marinigracilibium pacificum]